MHNSETVFALEQQTIYVVPDAQRHGRFNDLFTIWFGSNINMLTIVTGALGTTLFGLGAVSALVAIAVGALLGGVLMALHAAQGARLGVPQMVQTRGQFGAYGAIFVIAVVIVMYIGFFAANSVLAALSIADALHTSHTGLLILGVGALALLAAIYGYDLIHAYSRILTVASGLALVATFFWMFCFGGVSATALSGGALTASGFVGMLSVAALYQLGYAPYVSDYTRYMPAETGTVPAFWATYTGSVLGSILPMTLGVVLGLVTPDNVVAGLVRETGAAAPLIVIVFSLSITCNNAMNLYCGTLSVITIVQTFRSRWHPHASARAAISVILFAASLGLALAASADFMHNYENFLLLLLYVLIPWTSINLVDYYLIHKGHYDVDSFFAPDGGRYGTYNAAAITCYGGGILIQIPFVSNDLYTGPVARALGGADISWLVGILLISPVYYLMARHTGRHEMVVLNARV